LALFGTVFHGRIQAQKGHEPSAAQENEKRERRKNRMKRKRTTLSETVENGRLDREIKRYLKTCKPPDGEGKRATGRFPSVAGFCRFLGCGVSEIEVLRLSHPTDADYLLTVMEDEALNSPIPSPTVVSAYLKHRLSYGERSAPVSEAECGEMRVIFEHDIAEDGL
jgi:hypothetical protein